MQTTDFQPPSEPATGGFCGCIATEKGENDMRKHRKLAAVLSTTAVLTAFAPLFTTPVLAQSTGWVQENENWSYYDSDGYKLTDSWKNRMANGITWTENGNRAYNMQIDDLLCRRRRKNACPTSGYPSPMKIPGTAMMHRNFTGITMEKTEK